MICVFVLLLMSYAAYARVEVVEFNDPQKAALYKQMISELRCLVCQNQNLADSNAELAVDLRRRTRELIHQGMSRQEVTEYMVKRYGEFVLYRPRLKVSTLALWFSPIVLLAISLWLVMRINRRKTYSAEVFSASDRAMAKDLLTKKSQTTLSKSSNPLS